MPKYQITSQETGRSYVLEFHSAPTFEEVDTAIEKLDATALDITISTSILLSVLLWVVFCIRDILRERKSDAGLVEQSQKIGGISHMGGWLQFFAVTTTFVTPLLILGRALTFGVIVAEARKFPDSAGAVVLSWLIWAHIVLALIFATCVSVVGWRVWRVKPDALLWMRRFWWAFLNWQGCFLLLFWHLNPFPNQWNVLWGTIIDTILGFVIWRVYLQRSKRVANTFGPWHQAAYRKTSFFTELKACLISGGRQIANPHNNEGQTSTPVAAPQPPSDTDAVETHVPNAPDSAANDLAHVDSGQAGNNPLITLLNAYSKVAEEAKQGYFHQGLWLMCLTDCDGDEERATLLYNRKRAEMIQNGEIE